MEQGLVPRNDVLAVEVTLANARQQELQALNALDISRATYNRLLSRSLTDPVLIEDLEPQPFTETLERLTEQALRSRVELKQISYEADALQFQAGAVLATRMPQVEFQGGEICIRSPLWNRESYWFATVGMKGEILDFTEKKLQAGALRSHATSAIRCVMDYSTTGAQVLVGGPGDAETDRGGKEQC